MPVLTSKRQTHKQKRSKIRYTEYYDLQETFDKLYADSVKGKIFTNLMALIDSDENIRMAYRTIKRNHGSNTPGVDRRTIQHLAKLSEEEYLSLIHKQFRWYTPRPVRRVEIPKPNGKTRPLGIPTIVDRIVQQCVLQVLEPICEAKFHENSNGFRPNRSAETAIAQCMRMMQVQNLHYVVDIDIKGFFDNVCHDKLIKQMWHLGIRDKKLLCVIKQMLKAEVVMPDGTRFTPTRGTPQGGLCSPLFGNIVLNELDWWISSQWENMPTHYPYKQQTNKSGTEIKSHTYRALRTSDLKEMYIVRYADDFKIFCSTRADAERAFIATKQWLKERLHLDISPEKSKIVNLKQRYSEFLGFRLKVHVKGGEYKVCSHVSDKALSKCKEKIRECVHDISHPKGEKMQYVAIQRYNAVVAGLHDYYHIATCVNLDFDKIAYAVKRQFKGRIGKELSKEGTLRRGFIKDRYGDSRQMRFLNGHPIIPVGYVQTKNAQHKKKAVNRYTAEGRIEIHKNLGINTGVMLWMMRNTPPGQSIEYADNRISLYAAQYGKCAVTGAVLEAHDVHCHHKLPRKAGGTDAYGNLVLVTEDVHRLIHAKSDETIRKYLSRLNLNSKQLKKLNKLRALAEMPEI